MSGRIPATQHDDSRRPRQNPTDASVGAAPHARTSAGAHAGQGLVEYGLILTGIAVVAIVALAFFGDQVAFIIDAIGTAIDRAGR